MFPDHQASRSQRNIAAERGENHTTRAEKRVQGRGPKVARRTKGRTLTGEEGPHGRPRSCKEPRDYLPGGSQEPKREKKTRIITRDKREKQIRRTPGWTAPYYLLPRKTKEREHSPSRRTSE